MTPQQQFWEWFQKHDQELMNLEADRERIFDQTSAQLKKVHPDLTFEFGPKRQQREFVVSAGGIRRVFPAVTALVTAAPKMEHWHVTAFRPRRSPPISVQFAGKTVRPDHVKFTLLDDGKAAGIYLFIPGYTEDDKDLKQIGYLLLDDILGEYDVETKLGLIKMFPSEAETQGDRYPLSDLAAQFDELAAQLGLGDRIV